MVVPSCEVKSTCHSVVIISLITVVLKQLILMFDKINSSELECCMDGIKVIFELAISPSLILLLFSSKFQVLRTVKNPSQGPGSDRCDLQTGSFR